MKKSIIFVMFITFFAMSLTGCRGPMKKEVLVEIQPDETAFMVPLEGNTLEGQQEFMSIEYLENAKVATKRVSLPQRKLKTGRLSWLYKWIVTAKVITVKRSPITCEWTPDATTGTSANDQAIWVESKDSIGFAVGVNLTALVEEKNASKFLYYCSGQSLATVMNNNVRGAVYSILSKEFGSRMLKDCKTDKSIISDIAEVELLKKFNGMGITITNFGLVGGLQYENQAIQKSINDAYIAEMKVTQAEQDKLAQVEINAKNLSIAVTAKQEAQEFAQAQDAMIAKVKLEIEKIKAEATKIAAETWNGQVPSQILPQGSNLLFGLDGDSNLS